MPEFYAEHVPSDLDEFTTGYLEAVEWLLPEEQDGQPVDRDKLRGFTRAAVAAAKRDCADFQVEFHMELLSYCDLSGRSMQSAGTDFYLSRCGHGAGYFDRGNEPVFNVLQAGARGHGNVDHYVWRGFIYEAGSEPKRRAKRAA